jgi:hypothetical protein
VVDERAEAREKWRAEAVKRATERIGYEKKRDGRQSRKPDAWSDELRKRLVTYWRMGILAPREQLRLDLLSHDELAAADRKRLTKHGLLTRDLHIIGITRDVRRNQIHLIDRAMQMKTGGRLHEGSLRLLVFIGSSGHAVGASIQIQGVSAPRNRRIYARYDLDVVSLGDDQLAHFDAHWHYGEDPSGKDDPRWPTMVLDPDEALDVLIEMWFPGTVTAM